MDVGASNAHGTAGTTPFATLALATAPLVTLDVNKAAKGQRRVIIDPLANGNLLGLAGFTSRDYVGGLQYRADDERAFIVLEGRVPNMVENGWSGGDMRQWLLSGKNVKMGKNGPYNTVPFNHGTPGTGGRNVGKPMPKSIYEAARQLGPTLSRPGGPSGPGATQWGDRLHPGRPMKQQAVDILNSKDKPWHSTSIYTDIQDMGAGQWQ